MKKPTRKRPADTNTRMHSILADVVAISNKPITKPVKAARKTKRRYP